MLFCNEKNSKSDAYKISPAHIQKNFETYIKGWNMCFTLKVVTHKPTLIFNNCLCQSIGKKISQ